MLLFSTEKNWISIFGFPFLVFPYFRLMKMSNPFRLKTWTRFWHWLGSKSVQLKTHNSKLIRIQVHMCSPWLTPFSILILPGGQVTAGSLRDASSIGHVSFVDGHFPDFSCYFLIAAFWWFQVLMWLSISNSSVNQQFRKNEDVSDRSFPNIPQHPVDLQKPAGHQHLCCGSRFDFRLVGSSLPALRGSSPCRRVPHHQFLFSAIFPIHTSKNRFNSRTHKEQLLCFVCAFAWEPQWRGLTLALTNVIFPISPV